MVHTPISGYRELNEDELKAINQLKEIEERTLRVLDAMQVSFSMDPRWMAIAKTHIEQGFMAANRSIARPKRIALPEDERPVEAPSSEEPKESAG
jgi:hypothetical protein